MYKHCYDDNHSFLDFDAKEDNYNTSYTIHKYEYENIKLFILSLIRKASISTINNFSRVNLGKYEKLHNKTAKRD